MGNRYVTSTITRQTQAVSQSGFGMALVLGTSKVVAYAEYTDVASVTSAFGVDSAEEKLAKVIFGQNPRPSKIAMLGIVWAAAQATQLLLDSLNALMLTKNDWYYLLCPEQGDAAITALSAWVATQSKLYAASTSNKALAALNNDRAFILVHPQPATYPAEAWVGRCAPLPIGSFTWTFKNLSGIAPAAYKADEVQAIHDAKLNTYITEGGVNITSNGVCTSGEHIDVMQSLDFINATITENVFGLLVNTDKVPFTIAGIALVQSRIEKALKTAYNNGIIAEDKDGNPLYTITAPNLSDISKSDKASRKLPGMKWQATIAGAIENVDVNGELSV